VTVVGGAFSENLGKGSLEFKGRVSTTPVQVREAEACALPHFTVARHSLKIELLSERLNVVALPVRVTHDCCLPITTRPAVS